MLSVEYTPEYTGSHAYSLKIGWNTDQSDMNTININEGSIYQDLRVGRVKLAGLLTSWGGKDVVDVKISVPKSMLRKNTRQEVIEHVLVTIINWFFPVSHMSKIRVFITHESSYKKTKILQEVVDKAKKVVGARMFAMIPSNVATPTFVATKFKELFSPIPNCTCRIIDYDELKELGFGLILGVGDSAKDKPCFVVIERRGQANGKKVAIAGKGITFDSGGLAVKTFHGMVDMKYDKIGAVYGASALLHLLEDDDMKNVTFIGAFPLAENAISGRALNPGDVISSYNKKTVEVVNPDAEGRLVLADAFGFLDSYKPDLLIDVATLTGHASSINCWHSGYFYCNDNKLGRYVEEVTDVNGERMLPMPTWEDYDDVLNSNVADYANSPLKCGDSFVATLFLKQFVPKGCKWLHIDLANEFDPGCPPKGNGIRTIIDTVKHYVNKK